MDVVPFIWAAEWWWQAQHCSPTCTWKKRCVLGPFHAARTKDIFHELRVLLVFKAFSKALQDNDNLKPFQRLFKTMEILKTFQVQKMSKPNQYQYWYSGFLNVGPFNAENWRCSLSLLIVPQSDWFFLIFCKVDKNQRTISMAWEP